jgi:hypothetical protein
MFSSTPVGREDRDAINNTFELPLVPLVSYVQGFCVLIWTISQQELLYEGGI